MKRINEIAQEAGMYIIDDQFSTYGKYTEKLACLIIEEIRCAIHEFTLRYDDRSYFNIQDYEWLVHTVLDDFKKELLEKKDE